MEKNLEPNWWMTQEYADKAQATFAVRGNLMGFLAQDGLEWLFPPAVIDGGLDYSQHYYCGPIGAHGPQVVDRQYIYTPAHFLDLSGGRWKVFRRNVNRFARPLAGGNYIPLTPGSHQDQVEALLESWATWRPMLIQDPETLARFVMWGELRWGLFLKDKLVGVNVADINSRHIIYRYCIDDGTPYTQEYLRFLFYTTPYWTHGGCVGMDVNDGGDLDSPTLAAFKNKLNPVRVDTVYGNWRAP